LYFDSEYNSLSFPTATHIKTPSIDVSCQYEAKIKHKKIPENSLKHCYTAR